MEFIMLDDTMKAAYRDEMYAMLMHSDREFVPPLSARSSTTQKDLSSKESSEEGLHAYFSQMCDQKILAAFEGTTLLGFVSFREDYTSDVIGADRLPNIYLSTLVSKPEARGRGMTVQMYEHLFCRCYQDRSIFTRTWSTNAAHIRILDKFGFRRLCTIPDDRGAGIDTVYFARENPCADGRKDL